MTDLGQLLRSALLDDMWADKYVPSTHDPLLPPVEVAMFRQLATVFQSKFPDLSELFRTAVALSKGKKDSDGNVSRMHTVLYALSLLANAMNPRSNGVQRVVGLMLVGAGTKSDVRAATAAAHYPC